MPKAASRSRIFDLSSDADLGSPAPPLSKVEVPLPSFANTHHSRSYALLWGLVVIGLLAVGFASYRLGALLFAKPVTPPEATVTDSKPVVQPTLAKAPPKVSGDLANTELYLPDAEYPSDASQNHDGTVTVQVRVSQKGIVIAAKALDGEESLRAAAEQAAKNSAFSPDKLDAGKPPIEGTITYTFIHGQNSKPIASTQGTVTAVTGGPLAGTELQLAHPDYPSNAKRDGAGGQYTVVVRVNRNGRVMSWRPLGGDPRLRGAVIAAARKSSFSPTKLPGTGDVVGTITYTFQ
jgi:TonB family protein